MAESSGIGWECLARVARRRRGAVWPGLGAVRGELAAGGGRARRASWGNGRKGGRRAAGLAAESQVHLPGAYLRCAHDPRGGLACQSFGLWRFGGWSCRIAGRRDEVGWTDARDSRRRFSLQACAGGIGVLCLGEVTRAAVFKRRPRVVRRPFLGWLI